jgi:hypothetical protein
MTSVSRMCEASCQPTTRRLKTSMTNAKIQNAVPAAQRVKSHTHSPSGCDAVKSRSTRVCRADRVGVGDRGAPGLAAALGALNASLAHQPLDLAARHCSPARRSAFHMRR